MQLQFCGIKKGAKIPFHRHFKRVIGYANLVFRMEGFGLRVDLRKGLKMVNNRTVPWKQKIQSIIHNQMLSCQSFWF